MIPFWILDLAFWIAEKSRQENNPVGTSFREQIKIQNLKWMGIFAIAFTFVFGGAWVSAQQTGKVFRIGFLDTSTASGSAVLLDAFRHELGKLG